MNRIVVKGLPGNTMRSLTAILLYLVAFLPPVQGEETIWIEAEHLRGVSGYCWPDGPPAQTKTDGRWGISGPGWAPAWTQGGESGFMSIACGADDARAVASTHIEIPTAGLYHLWVRYRDNRGCSSRFQVRVTDSTGHTALLTYGEKPVVEEDNEMKLYWNWAFAWAARDIKVARGMARLELRSAFKEKACRSVDCLVLTTDSAYRPLMKERPRHPSRDVLAHYAQTQGRPIEPLARQRTISVPDRWKPRTFRDRGFLYLWNMSQVLWAGDNPKRVRFPYHIGDKDVREAFEKKYGGQDQVPIFSDPRIVPTFHGVGPEILDADAKDTTRKKEAHAFMRWLDAHPERSWAMMMNYHADTPVSPAARASFLKYRERYVGNIAGESLGYFSIDDKALKAATAKARTRRELVEAFTHLALAANAAKYRKVFGQDWPDAYREVIPCPSIGLPALAPLAYAWGARTVGYESSAITSGILALRMAFLRGAARQNGGLMATYRSCNLGDSSTIFSDTQSYTHPANILDNFYSVFSGAGMTWYKMDIWYQYLAGSAMFYHEQGFDEYWMPGGTAAAGRHGVQLSPKGKLVDRFLRVTQQHPDRGTPVTPMAFLVDYAHGWDPAPFTPHAFDGMAGQSDLTRYGDHERMLQEYFWTAYYPVGVKGMEATTGTNEVYVPGIFGDVFDVVYAYPDLKRWTTLSTYPVVISAGDIELTAAEGQRLAQYVRDGGTLLVADGQLSGAGVAALQLPAMGPLAEASRYTWALTNTNHASQRFRYRSITGGKPLAQTEDGHVCCAAFDRGRGRLIVLGVPRGLGIDGAAVPIVAHLMAHLRQGLMPVEVTGDVEWTVNRTRTGWLVLLLNPAGQTKPEHGIFPTDYRENRRVIIHAPPRVRAASDWLFPEESLTIRAAGGERAVDVTVPAGGVRIIEIRE